MAGGMVRVFAPYVQDRAVTVLAHDDSGGIARDAARRSRWNVLAIGIF
jgi:hypothetical protein